jgi:recombination protein RecR
MSVLPEAVQKVIDAFEKLPGIGPKSAARMAYHFLRSRNNDAEKLANSLLEMDQKIVNCDKCFNVSEDSICPICSSNQRIHTQLCIVEDPLDVVAFENSAVFKGIYFVLGGVISPADGIGADELRFPQLRIRVNELLMQINKDGNSAESVNPFEHNTNESDKSQDSNELISYNGYGSNIESDAGTDMKLELIIATNPNLEGEATAVYIQDMFKKESSEGKIHVSRLAMGLPTGADLEYADRLTLKRALEGRRGY